MIAELKKITVEGVTVSRGNGGLEFVNVVNDFARASICTHGAHLTEFTPHGAAPLIWMSTESCYSPEKPIRGGVPVCWPWFGPAAVPGQPAHGFARLAEWKLIAAEELTGGATGLRFALDESIAPEVGFGFRLELSFTIGRDLEMALTTINRSPAPVTVGEALHSYFNISDISSVEIVGLDGIAYEDHVRGAARPTGNRQSGTIRVEAETDRLYLPTQDTVEIVDHGLNRTIRVEKSGSLATVVWNPWIEKSRAMADFGDEEYHTMLCIEAANAGSDIRTILPGQSHTLVQKISLK